MATQPRTNQNSDRDQDQKDREEQALAKLEERRRNGKGFERDATAHYQLMQELDQNAEAQS